MNIRNQYPQGNDVSTRTDISFESDSEPTVVSVAGAKTTSLKTTQTSDGWYKTFVTDHVELVDGDEIVVVVDGVVSWSFSTRDSHGPAVRMKSPIRDVVYSQPSTFEFEFADNAGVRVWKNGQEVSGVSGNSLTITNGESLQRYDFAFLLTDTNGNTNHTRLSVSVRPGVSCAGGKSGMMAIDDNEALDRRYFVDAGGIGEIFVDGTSIYDGTDFTTDYQNSTITVVADDLVAIHIEKDSAWGSGEHVLRVCPQNPTDHTSAHEIFYVGDRVRTQVLNLTSGARDIRTFDVSGKFSNPLVYNYTGYGSDGKWYEEGVADSYDLASWGGPGVFPVSGMCVVMNDHLDIYYPGSVLWHTLTQSNLQISGDLTCAHHSSGDRPMLALATNDQLVIEDWSRDDCHLLSYGYWMVSHDVPPGSQQAYQLKPYDGNIGITSISSIFASDSGLVYVVGQGKLTVVDVANHTLTKFPDSGFLEVFGQGDEVFVRTSRLIKRLVGVTAIDFAEITDDIVAIDTDDKCLALSTSGALAVFDYGHEQWREFSLSGITSLAIEGDWVVCLTTGGNVYEISRFGNGIPSSPSFTDTAITNLRAIGHRGGMMLGYAKTTMRVS